MADEVGGVGDVGVIAALRADLQHDACLVDGLRKLLAVLDGHAHRLLDQHVLAGGDRLAGRADMELIGDRDDDRVDVGIVEHRLVAGVGLARRAGRGHALKQILGRVADGVELGVAGLAAAFEVPELRDRPRAEHADAQAPIGRVGHRRA